MNIQYLFKLTNIEKHKGALGGVGGGIGGALGGESGQTSRRREQKKIDLREKDLRNETKEIILPYDENKSVVECGRH